MNGKMLIVSLALILLSAPMSALAKPDHQPQSARRVMEVKRNAQTDIGRRVKGQEGHSYHVRKNLHEKGVKAVRAR